MDEQRKDIDIKKDGGETEIDIVLLLSGLWKYVRKFWWLVLLFVVAGAGGLYAFQTLRYEPMYRSSATFTVSTQESSSGVYSFYYNSGTADQLSRTFPYILDSSFFRSALMERLDTDVLNGTISAETITDSNVVTMTVVSSSAEDAKTILDAALEIYPTTARFVLGDIEFNFLDEPELPESPYNHMGTLRVLVFGGCGGGFAALLLLGLLALFRRTARNTEEMKKITSLRCMATIPQVRFKARKQQKSQNISADDKRVPYGYKESIRALGVRLEKEMKKKGAKVLLITSTVPGEGKSTLAVNLAENLAEKGSQVLLIDGDLRKQADVGILGSDDGHSLIDVVEEDKKPRELVRKVHKSTLWFLGSSRTVRQPASLLSSEKVSGFIKKMREIMDYVIIDTPPCEMFQDAGMLADMADGILYVVKYDFVPQQKILEGLSALRGKRAAFLGYAFNCYPESSSEYGYGRYGYGGYGRYGYGGYGRKKYGYDKYRYGSAASGGSAASAKKRLKEGTEDD